MSSIRTANPASRTTPAQNEPTTSPLDHPQSSPLTMASVITLSPAASRMAPRRSGTAGAPVRDSRPGRDALRPRL